MTANEGKDDDSDDENDAVSDDGFVYAEVEVVSVEGTDSDDEDEMDEKPSRRKNPKRGVAAAMAAIREECDAWKQCALGLKTNSVAPLTIETVASFSQQRNPSPAPYQNKTPWSPPPPSAETLPLG